jgi:ketosteroid isomerase-like protein
MSNKEVLERFYTAFQQGDAATMSSLYHPDGYFSDPVFQALTAEEAGSMWTMLIERSKGNLAIEFHSIEEDEYSISCTWEAKYLFSKTERPVHNVIRTKMTIEDDKIIIHEDVFNFWKWSRMALGAPGLLFGWTPFLKKKVQTQAQTSLQNYILKES